MAGFLLYMVTAFGLGAFVPRPGGGQQGWIGLRTFTGACLMVIVLYVLQALLGAGVALSGGLVAGLGVAGMVWLLWRDCRRQPLASVLFHPVVVLSLAIIADAAVRGGIGYIPYTGDDLMTWTGKARTIFAVGDYTRAVPDLHLPFYTPGWPLVLLYPWSVVDAFDPGLAAAAPAALHVALLGLVFDGVLAVTARRGLGSPPGRLLWAWLFVLAALLAELSGKLFAINLLVEPPQVYCLAALFLAALLALDDAPGTSALAVHIGVIVAASYLIKVAILAFVPALVVLAVFLARTTPEGAALRPAAAIAAGLFLPLVLVTLSWQAVGSPGTCLGSAVSTLSTDNLSKVLTPGAADLAWRYGGALSDYIATYKVPVTAVALAGMAWAAAGRRYAALVGVFALYCLAYFGALYWYHLTCFGEYYFHNLNSIPRFTRVPVRVFHVLGTVLLALMVLETGVGDVLRRWLSTRAAVPVMVVALLPLAAWQVWQLDRSVAAVSTRAHQTIEPYLAPIARESRQLVKMATTALPAEPKVQIIYQDDEAQKNLATLDTYFTATYYGMGHRRGAGPRRFRVLSYAPTDPAAALFRDADVVWPLRVNGSTRALISQYIDDPRCRETPEDYFLLPAKDGGTRLRCVAKEGNK